MTLYDLKDLALSIADLVDENRRLKSEVEKLRKYKIDREKQDQISLQEAMNTHSDILKTLIDRTKP